jgi:hypothetical protein
MTQTSDETQFGNSLIALGRHLNDFPGLPKIYSVTHSLDGFALQIRIYRVDAAGLAKWAATLSNVNSHAHRITDNQIDGHVRGDLNTVTRVDIIGGLPPDMFPAEAGSYPWDVTVLLQEA